ncbi:hypothetical protein JQ596_00980 [Bradyrhizobium manausense]|nr:hypothetical protein [Bradyrhizobium manausense]UVO33402.1 hypothetical protein KUF59_28585 [Bradyrhizobium arachidis]
MRVILSLLSGLVGALAGWLGLALLAASIAGPDRDGGIAMGAFFDIGPIGGLVGFAAGVWLFVRTGVVRDSTASPDAATAPRTRISRPYAVVLLLLVGGIAWWTWYEFIRSPYLTHGFMTLELQFRLPAGMTLPPKKEEVQIEVSEGQGHAIVDLTDRWRGHDGERQAILATASLMYKTSNRIVTLVVPDIPKQTWRLDLTSDPDPTPGFSGWRLPSGAPAGSIELNYRLRADR